MMRAGANLHIFPEGTRTRDGRIAARVFTRLIQACFDAGIEVVPCAVWGTDRAVGATGFSARPFQRFGLELAAPLDRADFTSAEDFANASWAKVVELARLHGADEPFSAA